MPWIFFQLLLFCRNALFVFSDTLKMYFAWGNVTSTEGSVSDDRVVRTDADQSIVSAARFGPFWPRDMAEEKKGLLRESLSGMRHLLRVIRGVQVK